MNSPTLSRERQRPSMVQLQLVKGKRRGSVCSGSPANRSRVFMAADVGGAFLVIGNGAANAEILSKP